MEEEQYERYNSTLCMGLDMIVEFIILQPMARNGLPSLIGAAPLRSTNDRVILECRESVLKQDWNFGTIIL